MSNITRELSSAAYWDERAAANYEQLGWVNADNLLNKMVQLAGLQGNETVVDAGTGSGAILNALAPQVPRGRVIGFDLSAGMLGRRSEDRLPTNARLILADIHQTPFPDGSIDLVAARQVFHNLPDIGKALQEMRRILRPDGKLIICEYTPPDEDCLKAEQPVWDLKERGRNLWTGQQLAQLVRTEWWGRGQVSLETAMLKDYSNRDWMRSSGLPTETQQEILDLYLQAPQKFARAMNIRSTDDGDTLVDRPFSFVVATKHL